LIEFQPLRIARRVCGWVAERLKAPVLKTGRPARVSWVRIPPHPPGFAAQRRSLPRRSAPREAGLFAGSRSYALAGLSRFGSCYAPSRILTRTLMQAWQQFYEMLGGVAATLLGLLFVSVSINAETILGPAHAHSRHLAEQAFQNYLMVLIVSLLSVIPTMQPASLGQSLLWMSGIWGIWAVSRAVRSIKLAEREGWFKIVRRYTVTLLGFAMLVYAGLDLLGGAKKTPDLVAVGVMILLISATVVSWELLLKLAQDRYARKDG
jgi:hypothetical protein